MRRGLLGSVLTRRRRSRPRRCFGRHAPAQRLALAALFAGIGLCACGGHSPPTGPPATGDQRAEERVLHVYNWSDYIGFETIAQFERETGIEVVYDVYDSNQLLETKLLSGDTGYDVVSTDTGYYGRQIKAGAYEPLDKSQLSNWHNLDPAVLAAQAGADPGNRYAVPYLHATNGFAYNVGLVTARMKNAPTDSLDMIFKPSVVARFADCGVSFLDSAEDVLQLALSYLHLDPNSHRVEDLRAAERLVLQVRPYVRTFDSSDYVNQLAAKELCVAMGWSSDYSTAQARSRAAGLDLHLAFTLPKEGSNITYNALLIPRGAPHQRAAHKFIDFILSPRVIAAITNDIHYGNDNLAARPYIDPFILSDPAIYPPPDARARLYVPEEVGMDYERLRTRVWTRIKTGL
jgi:putrescine transport system substrate-binding protein